MTEKRYYDKHPITDSLTFCECGHTKIIHEGLTYFRAILSLFGITAECANCQCNKYVRDKSVHYYWDHSIVYVEKKHD